MTPLSYLIKVFVCSGILLGYYWLFLRNKKFHHYNRFYLLATLLLSISLPFINITVFDQPGSQLRHVVYKTANVITVNALATKAAGTHKYDLLGWFLSAKNDLYVLYAAVIALILFTLVRTFLYIRRISKKYPYEFINNLKFYNTSEPGTPFSFFRSIFWNNELKLDSENGQQIFRHELFHVQQKHSADSLLAEIITACFWYNPLFHLIKKELKAIHEFLADQYAASCSDRYAYAELLVQQTVSTSKLSISNYFFQNHIKRRIAMITQRKKGRYNYWSRLMPLPVSILLFCSIALYAKPKTDVPHKGIPVVNNAPTITDTVPEREKQVRGVAEDKANSNAGSNDQGDLLFKLKTGDQYDKDKIRAYINSLTTEQLKQRLEEELQKHLDAEFELQYQKALQDSKGADLNKEEMRSQFLEQEKELMNVKGIQDKNARDLNEELVRLKMKQLSDLDGQKLSPDILIDKALEQQKYLSDIAKPSNDLLKMKALNDDQMQKYLQGQQSKLAQDDVIKKGVFDGQLKKYLDESQMKLSQDQLSQKDKFELLKDYKDQLMDAQQRANADNQLLLKKLKDVGDKPSKDILLSKQAEIQDLRERINLLEERLQRMQDEMERNKKDDK